MFKNSLALTTYVVSVSSVANKFAFTYNLSMSAARGFVERGMKCVWRGPGRRWLEAGMKMRREV